MKIGHVGRLFSTTQNACGPSGCKWNTLEKLVKVGSRKKWEADTAGHHEVRDIEFSYKDLRDRRC